ncbi:MAG TPA: efflux RND transporter periplasmic adaptor subunit [Sedimenticola sp.]|nr:efflux RND transporter periplasmic adaptor subunit [Sedimenticola sp.]
MRLQAALFPLALLAALLTGCSDRNEYVEPPPPKVTVATPLSRDVTDYLEFTGTTHASAAVDVRARVRGFLESVHFVPGERVEKGDLLFVIDPREYQAELQAAEAEVAAAEAELKRADIELQRARRLYKQKAGSESDVVKWRGEQELAKASILRAQAKVVEATLQLSYTQVTSPISGRVSRNLVDPGNLVGDKESTLLTTVMDYSPMYVYYNMNERDLLMAMKLYKARIEERGLSADEGSVRKAEIPLYLGLADEEGYPHEGVVDFADSGVNTETGTLEMRGVFENSQVPPALIPGLFARIRMPIRQRKGALLVSERALGADQGGPYLLVVNAEGVVEKRDIRKGQLIDGLVVIDEGIAADDRVIVKGLQRARPGGRVTPETAEMADFTTEALKAQAAGSGQEGGKPGQPGGAKAKARPGAGKPAQAPEGEKKSGTAPAPAVG